MLHRTPAMAAILVLFVSVAAAGTAPAATTTVGSLSPGVPTLSCGNTTWVPTLTASGSPSYEIPAGFGVITGWQTKLAFAAGPSTLTMKLKVLRRTASPTQFLTIGSSDPQAVPKPASGTVDHSFTTRLPVAGGDLVGMKTTDATTCGYVATGNQFQFTGIPSDPNVGETVTLSGDPQADRLLNIRATVESDADADGFGDDTQDQCPTDATTQGACTLAVDATAPILSKVKFSPKRFRVDRKASSAKGKRKRAPKGSTLKYELSEAATVAVAIERTTRGRRVKGKCRKGRPASKKKRCTLKKAFGSLTQEGLSGTNAKAFSGLVKGKALRRGSYIATLTAKDAAGNSSLAETAKFRIASTRRARRSRELK